MGELLMTLTVDQFRLRWSRPLIYHARVQGTHTPTQQGGP